MRLQNIQKFKVDNTIKVTDLSDHDTSEYIQQFKASRLKDLKLKVKQQVALAILKLEQSRLRKQLNCKIPFDYDLLCLGQRFFREASLKELLNSSGSISRNRMLMVGCSYGGEEVDFWLKRKIKKFIGIDIYRFEKHWKKIEPKLSQYYGCDVKFLQATVEALPFADGSFDLITSNAVLEHVLNLDLACREMSRVLSKDGVAWHLFGPLYFSIGGDHCISSYGLSHGFDHLVLSEQEYKSLVNNQSFFDKTDDPFQNYWAKVDLFSFLKPFEYLEVFSRYFHIKHLILQLSPQSIMFRDTYLDQWNQVLSQGVSEIDLIVEGMAVILCNK
jgi:ubiquinone/menaquinone biosynthesis C-methylase UbiE